MRIMNGNDILKAMNDIDPGVIEESEQFKKEHRRIRLRKPVMIIAASLAALALTVTAGAVMYNKVSRNENYNKEDVEHFVAGGTELPGMEAIKLDSEHYELTINDLWSDGNIATAIVTAKWKDEEGRDIVKNLDCRTGYADEPFTQDTHLTSSGRFFWENDYDTERIEMTGDSARYRFYFHCFNIDRSRNIKLYFFKKPEDYTVEYEIVPDIAAEVSFEKNLETAEFYSEEGYLLTLSPIGLYENYALGNTTRPSGHDDSMMIELIRYDGQPSEEYYKLVAGSGLTFSADDPTECYYDATFQHTVDITQIKEVRIAGKEYKRQ